jgi:hypothetical protein
MLQRKEKILTTEVTEYTEEKTITSFPRDVQGSMSAA